MILKKVSQVFFLLDIFFKQLHSKDLADNFLLFWHKRHYFDYFKLMFFIIIGIKY